MMNDRRSGLDRRKTSRNTVAIDITWEASSGRQTGTISDISDTGCFVLSGGDVIDGEPIRMFLPLGPGLRIEFHGTITNHVFEIGFAVRFDHLSGSQKDLIHNLIAFPVRA